MLPPDKKSLLCEQCGQPHGKRRDRHRLPELPPPRRAGVGTFLPLPRPHHAARLPRRHRRAVSPAAHRRTADLIARTYQHYEILTREDGNLWELGRGAMGVTYKAMDVNLRMPVALKVICARFSAHPEARARFLREARAAARLHHPNVASVHHFGTISFPCAAREIGDGTEYFYAMEFIEGETLESLVRRAGSLPPVAALEIALQIAHALGAAERRGMVHRDVKPANVMLTPRARPRWSPASPATTARRGSRSSISVWPRRSRARWKRRKPTTTDSPQPPAAAPLTASGGFLGTPQFASPEQFAGGDVDVRSDIFSLGVTLWYMLCGELPYDGGSLAEVRDRQLHRELPLAQLEDFRVPPTVVRLLRAMLAPDPQRRPPSASALCERLRRSLTVVREGGLIGQLKTRRVYRVVLGYAVGAWVILQICASGLRGFGAPVWAPHLLLVLLVAGLSAAGLAGWAVDRRAIGKSHLPRKTAKRVAFVAAAVLPSLLVAGYFHWTRVRVPPRQRLPKKR